MTNYTSGDWTVSDQYTDTVAVAKDISVPDLDLANDFAITKDESNEVIYQNVTASDIKAHESIRFACSNVNNVYAGVDSQSPAPIKSGVQVMSELKTLYKAVNSVTGDEYELPATGRIVLRLPTLSYVTADLVQDILNRTISSIFGLGDVSEAKAVNLIKGILKG